jgi:hypothetical protein
MIQIDMNTPVAIVIFNRPDLVLRLLEVLSRVKPAYLYVISDGAREDRAGEFDLVAECRRLVDREVNWHCDIKKEYSGTNMGCGHRISSGLNWLFGQVESAIILEDDCLPAPEFLYFAQEMLVRYKDDDSVYHISGSNLMTANTRSRGAGYYFSRYPSIWGWATWRRAWRSYDFNLFGWRDAVNQKKIKDKCFGFREYLYWQHCFDSVSNGRLDTWDYQWAYNCMVNGAFCIVPNINMISNLGFRLDATHTKTPSVHAALQTGGMVIKNGDPIAQVYDIIMDRMQSHRNYRLSFTTTVRALIRLLKRL